MNKNSGKINSQIINSKNIDTINEIKGLTTKVVDTVIQNMKIKINYHWNNEELIININNLVYDTSYYPALDGWDLYTPIFKFNDSTKTNIYMRNNIIFFALPYNHVNTFTVFVYKLDGINRKIEICDDIKCSDNVYVLENEGILSTKYNKDPINGEYEIKKLDYKIDKCLKDK